MPTIPTAEVPAEVLDSLFQEFDIWVKIKDSRLKSEIVSPVPSSRWPEATSMIIKHFLPNGKHVATTHCVKDSAGRILHWDAKDLRLNEVRLWRI